ERYSRCVSRAVFFQAAPNSVVPARMRKSGPRSLSPSVATNLALTLRVSVLTAPVKPEPFSFLVKLPMVAIVVFLLFLGPRLSRPRWWSCDRGRSAPHPQGWNAVEGGRRQLFCFAMQSRRRRKKGGDGRCGKTVEAQPVFGQTQSIR